MLFILICISIVLFVNSVGVTRAAFLDQQTSAANSFLAYTPTLWTQTSQADFANGVLNQVDITTSPGDVTLTQTSGQSVVADDDFESGGWSGGTGWLWGWWASGNASVTNSGGPHGGSYHMLLSANDGYADRALNLPDTSSARLQFWAKAESFEPGEFVDLLVHDGTGWTIVQTWNDGDDDNVYYFYDIDLSGFTASSTFYIGLDAEMSDTDDYLYIDDLAIVNDANSDWYDTDWQYRREITLSPATSMDNYQVQVTLTTAAMGNPYTGVKTDGSDIRFTGSDGLTLQDYWIESWDVNGNSVVWVEVADSGTSSLYMYYGNASASSVSDGDATFEFFDDFSDADISDWTQYRNGVVQLVNDAGNYVLMKTAHNDSHGGYSLFNNGSLSDFEAIFKTKRINETGGHQNRYGIEDGSFNGYGPRMADFNSLPAAFAIERRNGGSGGNIASKQTSAYQWNTWMTVKFRKSSTILEFELYDSSGVLVESISTTNSTYTSFDRFVIHGGWEFYTDDIIVRKYVSSDPAASIGSEEEPILSYVSSGTLASQVLDTTASGSILVALFWDESLPANTDITFEIRASDTLFLKDAVTPSWTAVGGTSPVTSGLPSGRYLQWRVTLTTSDSAQTPVLYEVRIYYYN